MKLKEHKYIVTTVLFFATFLCAMEGTIVTTVMPTIIASLHGVEIMNWVFSIYLLTNAMTTPIYGKLVDTIGRKPVFIIATLLFALGSFLAGISHDMVFLIFSRAIQGIGSGGIIPVSYTLLADLFEPKERAKMLGFASAIWGVSGVIGPVLGGIILKHLTWHWIFLVNIPIAAILIFLLAVFLKEKNFQPKKATIDYSGSILFMLAIFAFLLGVQFISDQATYQYILPLFFASGLLVWAFLRVEKKAIDPVLPMHLFSNRHFNRINLISFFASGFVTMLDVYIPLWLQAVNGFSPTISGVVLAPMSISWMIGSFLAGHLIEKIGDKKVLCIGGSIAILMAGFSLTFTSQTSIWLFVLLSAITGIGLGLQFTVFTVSTQVGVKEKFIGVATSFALLVRTVGQTILIAIFGVLLNFILFTNLPKKYDASVINKLLTGKSPLNDVLKELVYSGLHAVFFLGFILCLVVVILSFFMKGVSVKADTE